MKWFKGFFENGQPQSMTDGMTFVIGFGGLIYAFAFQDYGGGAVLIGLALGIKGHKNFETRKRNETKSNNNPS